MVHIRAHDAGEIPRPQKNLWGFVVVVASVVEVSAMDIRYRGKDLTVRANISNQGCALFGLSLVICQKPQMAIKRSELLKPLWILA